MLIQCIERFDELTSYRTAWNQLAALSPTSTIFQTFEWYESWWEAFGEAYTIQSLLGFRDGELAAVAPFMANRAWRYGCLQRALEFIGGPPSDYLDLLYRDPHDAQMLVEAYQTALPWDFLQLDRIPAVSPTVNLLTRTFPGWRGTRFVCDQSFAYVFDSVNDGSDILCKKSLRRHENGLKKAGALKVLHLTQSEEIEPYLESFFTQHITRRAQTRDASHFLDPRYKKFYRLLTHRLASQGWLLFTVVTLDNEPVAFHFGFTYGQKLLWYKPAFAPAHAHLSPGEVLLAALFRYCQEHGLRELDFTIGAEPFKARFSNTVRCNYRVEAFRSQPLQYLGYAERICREQVKRLEVTRRVRGAWEHLRKRLTVG